MKRTFLLLAIIGSLGMATMAQGSAGVVKISASPLKVKKGASGAGLVTLNINGGYHINSNRPTEAYLIATALKIQPQAGFTIGGVVYPKAKLQKFSFSENPYRSTRAASP